MADASRETAEWIEGAQQGDPRSFEALVDRYADRLYGYFFRLSGSSVDAEDLLQELFVRLVGAIRRYDHRDHFDAFLFRIATNLARDRVRRLKRRGLQVLESDRESRELSLAGGVADHRFAAPDARLDLQDQAARVQAAVAALPAAEREVIVLRHFSNLPFKEIASIMGTPLGTALARAHRGLLKLREALGADRGQ